MKNTRYCSLFGHRFVYDSSLVRDRLYEILEEIIKSGIKKFLVGTHGEFDSLAVGVLRKLREKYQEIEINVVMTGVGLLGEREKKENILSMFCDLTTTSYFVGDLHFKQRITATNELMVEDSEIVVCYYDPYYRSVGVKHVVRYAEKRNKKLINIFSNDEYSKFKQEKDILTF